MTAMIMANKPNCCGFVWMGGGNGFSAGRVGGPVQIDGSDKVILRWSKDVDHRPEWRKNQLSECQYAKIVGFVLRKRVDRLALAARLAA